MILRIYYDKIYLLKTIQEEFNNKNAGTTYVPAFHFTIVKGTFP